MKGIIFNLLEQSVTDTHGDDVWDDLLDASGSDGAFTSLGSYDDTQLYAMVEAASQQLSVPPATVIRWFGEQALPRMATAYPEFLAPHTSAIPFLLTLNDIIHPEVLKLYPGASAPTFDFERPDETTLVMTYHSERPLCALAEGMVTAAAAHYGEQVAITRPTCKQSGDDACVLHCSFTPAGAPCR